MCRMFVRICVMCQNVQFGLDLLLDLRISC